MSWIFKWKSIIIRIMRNIGVIMHHQKFPEGNIANQFFVFSEVLHEQRQTQHLVQLRVGVDVKDEEGYSQNAFHEIQGNVKL